ncbi:MAG TPA: Crp/Fnr family transcriptional regulator [Phenylobacterium sp.]
MAWSNHYLDTLSPSDAARLEPSLRRISLTRDQLVAEAGEPVAQVTLPISCVISVVAVMNDGRQVESRTVGRESGYGLLHALGSRYSFERVTAQIPGEAWRLPVEALTAAADQSRSLTKHIVRHAQATIVQSAQSTACNTLHGAEQRLARWLLLTQERLGSDVIPLTQEHLSIMLGVQRTTITAVASELQAAGIIRYLRGRITIRDRQALIGRSCECYETIEAASQRLLAEPID